MGDVLLIGLVAVAMVAGIAGTLLPVLPGIWLSWAAGVVYGFAAGPGAGGWAAMIVITALALAGTVGAMVVPQRRAAAAGVPWWGQLLAAVLAVIGFFVIPIVGAIVGFVLGILLASILRDRDLGVAWTATLGALRSMFIASAIQFAAACAIFVVWIGWVALAS